MPSPDTPPSPDSPPSSDTQPSPDTPPAPERRPSAEPRERPRRPGQEPQSTRDGLGGANTDLLRLVAAAADLCRKPLRHGVMALSEPDGTADGMLEVCLRLEARSSEGERLPEQDLELEIYPSGTDLNLTLAWCQEEQRPMLWQGSHPVWMDAAGSRCPAPVDGAPLEALARRLRALLVNS